MLCIVVYVVLFIGHPSGGDKQEKRDTSRRREELFPFFILAFCTCATSFVGLTSVDQFGFVGGCLLFLFHVLYA